MTLPRSGLCVWLVENLFQPIRSTTQLWVGTCHQHRGSTLISQSSFSWDTSNSITKGLLFSWGNQWWWHKNMHCFYRIEIVIPLAIFIFPFCNVIFFKNMTALPSYDLLWERNTLNYLINLFWWTYTFCEGDWIRKRFETPGIISLDVEDKKTLLRRLIRSQGYEIISRNCFHL